MADHEGTGYAEWLNALGVSAFVVKYRLGSKGYRHPAMLHDAARAVRVVRSRAEAWKIDPKRVAIMGSSAGGHLASTLLTHFDAGDPDADDKIEHQSSRPDLGILCYPVITLGEFTRTIAAGSGRSKSPRFRFRAGGIKRLELREDGEFRIEATKVDLAGIDLNQLVPFTLQIGNDKGETTIPFDRKGRFRRADEGEDKDKDKDKDEDDHE